MSMQSAADASSRAAVAASAAAAAVAVTKAAAARAATKAAHATRVAAGGKRRKNGSATNGSASQQRPSSSNRANGNGTASGKSDKSKDGDKSSDGAGLTDIEEQLLSGQQTCLHLRVPWDSCANHSDVTQLQDNIMHLSLCLNLLLLVDVSKPSATPDHAYGALELWTSTATLQANGNTPDVCRDQG